MELLNEYFPLHSRNAIMSCRRMEWKNQNVIKPGSMKKRPFAIAAVEILLIYWLHKRFFEDTQNF